VGRVSNVNMLAAALRYAGAGIRVFPTNGKAPLTEHGFHDASSERERVEAWWSRYPEAGIGTADFDAVDVDLYKPQCAETWERIRPLIPEGTPQNKTGGGGLQFLFEAGTLKDGKIGPGVDSRYADRNYVVLPPSLHPDGKRYEVVVDVLMHRPKPTPDFPRVSGSSSEFRHLQKQMDTGEKIVEGRNKAAWWRAVEILRTLPPTTELAAVNTLVQSWVDANCAGDLAEVDVAKQVRGAAKFVATEGESAKPVKPRYTGSPKELEEVVASFRRWLHLPDPGALYVALATVVANRLPGDPVWLLLVGASSCGKTEVLVSLGGLEEVEPAATLTEASLLSGVPRKDVAAGASGGLLRKIGEYGILTLKDFGSVLSMHRDARAGVLAALRECYDGSWDRPVGADGGKVLSWRGKLGLVAGVTTVVDRHHAVIDSLGSRFAFYRVDVGERKQQAGRALKHRHQAKGMRDELRDVVAGFFAGLELPADSRLSEADERRIVDLADFVTVARSPVERDAYKTREIELIPDAEAPARFAIMLASLLDGLRVIGIDDRAAWVLVVKVAFDSMPAQRRKVIEHLSAADSTTTKEAATLLGLPTTTARRTLEDLAAHGLVRRTSGSDPGEPDTWRLTSATPVPEMSEHPYKDPTPQTTTFRERA
jgi:Bifunctional DNA primase/polymerase, N-terminal/IclR helix-turn-helix domain